MRKRVVTILCALLVVGLCACANGQGDKGAEFDVQTQKAEIAEEKLVQDTQSEPMEEESVKDEQTNEQEEIASEEEQILGGYNLEKEVKEEEEPELQQEPRVFEEITTQLTTYPSITYTIMGEQKQIDYTMYENMYPYNMVSAAEYAIGHSTGDVTGDGVEELIVSIYVVGNTLTDTMQDTYVYCVDADINDLKEILYISAQGGEQFAAGYPNNIGVCASGNGTLQLSLATMKDENQEIARTNIELVYQDGMWNIK